MAIERYTFGGITRFAENNTEFLSFDEAISEDGKTVTIAVAGKLRSDVRYDLRDELMLCVAMNKSIDLNLEKLEQISSSCMSELLEVQQSIDDLGTGEMTLHKVPANIYKSLDSIGLTDLLMIED